MNSQVSYFKMIWVDKGLNKEENIDLFNELKEIGVCNIELVDSPTSMMDILINNYTSNNVIIISSGSLYDECFTQINSNS